MCKIHRKTPVLEYLFNKITGPQTQTREFLCKFLEIFYSFFTELHQATAINTTLCQNLLKSLFASTFNRFAFCLLKFLVRIPAIFFLMFQSYFIIINLFLIFVYCVSSGIHASHVYVFFVNIAVYRGCFKKLTLRKHQIFLE